MCYLTKKQIGFFLLVGLFAFSPVSAGEEETLGMPENDNLSEQPGWVDYSGVPATSSTFNYTVKKKLINGPFKNRVNIGYCGDGFAAADTNKFYNYADSSMAYRRGLTSIRNNAMVMRPYPRYDKFFNWYYINLISPSSGIPGPLGGSTSGRLGTINDRQGYALFHQAHQTLGIDTIHWHMAILNNSGYNNSGGTIAVFSYPSWGDIAVHETGHGFHHFADEYQGSGSDTREYNEMNSTATIGSEKWKHWVGYKDIDPRTRSGGGSPSNVDTVGYLPGSRYVSSGQYRPTSNSKMNMTSQTSPASYNAPCREKIIHDIYCIVKPIDTMLANTGTITDPDSVWVQVIDPAVLKVDWYVNNVLKKPNGGTSIRRSEITTTPGTFTVKAHVYDEVIRHMNSDNKNPDTLDLVRKDTAAIIQDTRTRRTDTIRMVEDVQWTVNVTNVAVISNGFEKAVMTLSVDKNAVVYTLDKSGTVVFTVMGIDGSVFNRCSVKGNRGRNSVNLFGRTAGIPAGVYLVKMATAGETRVARISIQ
ncbi:MAG: hypothetical protein JXA71_00735 [Chitinispirillaceae bacterium]|nr:hypothetical protein [Chitinispirillaceae bacterium]